MTSLNVLNREIGKGVSFGAINTEKPSVRNEKLVGLLGLFYCEAEFEPKSMVPIWKRVPCARMGN